MPSTARARTKIVTRAGLGSLLLAAAAAGQASRRGGWPARRGGWPARGGPDAGRPGPG